MSRFIDWCVPDVALRRWWLTVGLNAAELDYAREVARHLSERGRA